jgi:predicted ester cyclase
VAVRENKQLLKQLHESGYPSGPDALDQYFAPNYVAHGLWGDLSGLKAMLQTFLDAYPNAEWAVEDMIGELDRVAVRAQIRIRSAAGVVRTINSTMIYRIANNRIVEQWGHGEALF